MSGPTLADVFNSTSADFDAVTPTVWGPAGAALAAAADLRAGESVLDICCGTGASALAAARLVGPEGSVTAVDFAADLVERARAKADTEGLRTIDFEVGDVTALPQRYRSDFDALVCGFGVFFLPDMDDTVRSLLAVLRQGGRVAFAVWHEDALHDFTAAYFAEVSRVTGAPPPPSLRAPSDGPRHPITRIDTVDKITVWLESLGTVHTSATVLPLRVPRTDDFSWAMVLGSGMRRALLDLDAGQVTDIRTGFLRRLADDGMLEVNCDTIIATATRPGSD
ncbi:methyltransferase domain-containing protein [Gordonia sp. VNQ95]|uniref:class I SAM-dependent methyltransferase n=1 Tax=Gordonia TaxID=2053 RepID=UPI0032B62333